MYTFSNEKARNLLDFTIRKEHTNDVNAETSARVLSVGTCAGLPILTLRFQLIKRLAAFDMNSLFSGKILPSGNDNIDVLRI